MNHYYACDSCLSVIRVTGDPEAWQRLIVDHTLWQDGLPCFYDGCGDKLYKIGSEEIPAVVNAASHNVFRTLDLTVEEFFRALCGYGLPEEVGRGPEVARALLLSSRVSDVSVRKSPSGKAILDRLDLEDGTRLHLASSSHGPVVFKMTRRPDVEAGDDLGVLQQDTEDRVIQRRDQRGLVGGGGGDTEEHVSEEVHKHPDSFRGHSPGDARHVAETSGRGSDDDTWDDESAAVQTKTQRVFVG